jgi:hypothetical protein
VSTRAVIEADITVGVFALGPSDHVEVAGVVRSGTNSSSSNNREKASRTVAGFITVVVAGSASNVISLGTLLIVAIFRKAVLQLQMSLILIVLMARQLWCVRKKKPVGSYI